MGSGTLNFICFISFLLQQLKISLFMDIHTAGSCDALEPISKGFVCFKPT